MAPRFLVFLAMFGVLFVVSCSPSDKKDFEVAEGVFNDGTVEDARVLYKQFVAKYPTSEWRQLAERQLDQCDDIIQLSARAKLMEGENNYLGAIKIYVNIAQMNLAVVDTGTILPRLRVALEEHNVLMAAKVAYQDSVARAKASARSVEYANKLEEYAESLEVWSKFVSDNLSFVMANAANYDEHGLGNSFVARGVSLILKDEEYLALANSVSNNYEALSEVVQGFKHCRDDLDAGYSQFQELVYILEHLENYSRWTLRNRHAEISSALAVSIGKIRDCDSR